MKMYKVQQAELAVEARQLAAAAEAIYRPKFPTSRLTLVTTLLEHLGGLGFDALLNERGDLKVGGYFGSEVDVNDLHVLRTFFFTLAPYVVSGGTIEFWNEEENEQRWRFEDGKLQQQVGLAHWASIE